jgi:arylformamidase
MPPKWIDISVPLKTGMVQWPGDPAARFTRVMDIGRGDDYTALLLEMSVHTGTHMDAPAHVIRNGKTLDAMPPDAGVGPARVIAIRDRESIKLDELSHQQIRRGERILFKTRNSRRCWQSDRFFADFVSISADAARYLAERQVRLVGIDYLSVGGLKKDGRETHLALLSAGIWIIEGLNLSQVKAGPVELLCLPLKLTNADGAPARALVRQRRKTRS